MTHARFEAVCARARHILEDSDMDAAAELGVIEGWEGAVGAITDSAGDCESSAPCCVSLWHALMDDGATHIEAIVSDATVLYVRFGITNETQDD